ncbi:catecholate siderophore receptor Fiu [Xanthomonas graminis]|uniref:Catecholate siderophore receptor Fiu n=1 Tax=Xanthomonas graminis pv. phlei TaxID=487906 RepID=A0A0K2ZYE1_9XANT|nr:catecholate siderophore receptor Fiu [Xanthomonas translucens]UKE66892.1 catecholate siderophore receptor Fiu [Xanthomonas translucens pv. phlei]CTP90708.1 Catecholate siderophore receptor Fiu [Xanthomonas translucens pv. phlei]
MTSPIKSRKHAVSRPVSAQTLTAAALLGSLSLLSPRALATDADVAPIAPPTTLGKVDVEAQRAKRYLVEAPDSPKFTQPLIDTPQTINVISKDLFNEQGATTLTEALRNSPGVGTFYVGENGSTATGDAIYMRGFDSSSSIFVDGVRDLGSIARDVFNIEQIEVEKGPAGTDNGRSAPTGAINLVTKQANLSDAVSGTLSGGSDNQRRVTADWNQALGASSALRLNVMGQDSDALGRDHVNNKRWGLASSLVFGLGSDTRYYLDLLYVKQDNVPDGGVASIGLPGYTSPDPARPWLTNAPRVDSENFYGTRDDHDDVTAKMATFRFEHDVSDTVKLTNTARWGRNQQDYLLFAFMPNTANLRTPNPADTSTWTVARSLPTFKDQQYTIVTDQLNLRVDFATGAVQHALSTGVEAAREELLSWGHNIVNRAAWLAANPANVYAPDWTTTPLFTARNGAHSKGSTTTFSAYAFDTLKFGDSVLVTAGVRADRYKTDFNSLTCTTATSTAVPCTTAVGVDADISDTLFSWKLGAVYKAAENVSLYANYAISQQPPGGSALELSASANNANNPSFDPQKARTAEVGTKWNFLDDNLFVTMALFRTDVSNEIAQGSDGLYYQTGEKQVQGVELSAVGKLSDTWSISTGYTKLDAQVQQGAKVSQDGSMDLAYTPDSAFTAWTTYTLPFGLSVGGGARYSGAMKRGNDSAVGTPALVKSYTVWDAVLIYPINDHFDLRLNVYNVFDKEYVAAINKSGFRYTPGAPRSAMLSAELKF